jgi:Domain of unknown function (DUF4279)
MPDPRTPRLLGEQHRTPGREIGSSVCGAQPPTRKAQAMETHATFRLIGDDRLTSAAVTAHLGLEPTESHETGGFISARSDKVRTSSTWLLHSASTVEVGVELSEQIERLLTGLEPRGQLLWELVERRYWANWFCFVPSKPAEHAVELNRELLARLLRLPGDLWIDACGDEYERS